jgi:hypothetical protein
MEMGMLVLVLSSEDMQVWGGPPSEPTFGIVREVLDHPVRYQDTQCRVEHDNTSSVFFVGQLAPLAKLSQEDTQLAVKEAFFKWAPEIVKRRVVADLGESQLDFLLNMRSSRAS